MNEARPRFLRLAKALATLAALSAFVATLAFADLPRAASLVSRAGGWIALALVPHVFIVLADVLGWRTLLGPIADVPLPVLARVRLRCDAFGATLPGGNLIAESLAPTWLHTLLPLDTGVALVAGRKCFVGLAEAIYILLSFAVGFTVLATRTHALPWVVLGFGLGMLLLFGGVSLALGSGAFAARLHALLAAIPVAPVRAWMATRAGGFRATDERLRALFRASPRRLLASCALFVVCWSLEAVESWVILRLVGVELPFRTVYAFEASVSLLRSFACFAPGGLGVQDLGYVAALGAVGVPDAVTAGAAFIVLKRTKEIVWSLVGYATFLSPSLRARERPRAFERLVVALTGAR